MNKTRIIAASATLFAAAAYTGLLSGCQHQGSGSDNGQQMSSDLDKHACAGKNQCKGHGGCKTGDNGCKGKNSCKGKGGCNSL